MDDHVLERWESSHQPVLHDMGRAVCRLERRAAVEPQVEVHEHVIG